MTETTKMERMRLFIHAIFGGTIGIFTSIIFLLLYYGTTYDSYVSDAVRFRTAFSGAIIIVLLIFGILFLRDIRDFIHANCGDDSSDEIE